MMNAMILNRFLSALCFSQNVSYADGVRVPVLLFFMIIPLDF